MKTIKAKVHMLPTEIKAKDWRQQIVVLKDGTGLSVNNTENHQNKIEILSLLDATCIPQHLYITTDEEIKEGDWVYYNHNGGVIGQYKKGMGEIDGKIIATTDPKLNEVNDKNKVDESWFRPFIPKIPQSFIEEYCKVGGIDEVLIEYTSDEFSESTKLLMEAYGDNPDDFTKESELKLNPDNTIIIHPVEEKMYTLKQIKHMFDIGRDSAFQEMHFDEAIKYRDNELNKMD